MQQNFGFFNNQDGPAVTLQIAFAQIFLILGRAAPRVRRGKEISTISELSAGAVLTTMNVNRIVYKAVYPVLSKRVTRHRQTPADVYLVCRLSRSR